MKKFSEQYKKDFEVAVEEAAKEMSEEMGYGKEKQKDDIPTGETSEKGRVDDLEKDRGDIPSSDKNGEEPSNGDREFEVKEGNRERLKDDEIEKLKQDIIASEDDKYDVAQEMDEEVHATQKEKETYIGSNENARERKFAREKYAAFDNVLGFLVKETDEDKKLEKIKKLERKILEFDKHLTQSSFRFLSGRASGEEYDEEKNFTDLKTYEELMYIQKYKIEKYFIPNYGITEYGVIRKKNLTKEEFDKLSLHEQEEVLEADITRSFLYATVETSIGHPELFKGSITERLFKGKLESTRKHYNELVYVAKFLEKEGFVQADVLDPWADGLNNMTDKLQEKVRKKLNFLAALQ